MFDGTSEVNHIASQESHSSCLLSTVHQPFIKGDNFGAHELLKIQNTHVIKDEIIHHTKLRKV